MDSVKWHNEKGKFAKGNPGKLPGTSKNQLRDQVKEFVSERWPEFGEWFGKLEHQQKIDTMLALLPYCVPRLRQTDITLEPSESEAEFFRQELRANFDRIFPYKEDDDNDK